MIMPAYIPHLWLYNEGTDVLPRTNPGPGLTLACMIYISTYNFFTYGTHSECGSIPGDYKSMVATLPEDDVDNLILSMNNSSRSVVNHRGYHNLL